MRKPKRDGSFFLCLLFNMLMNAEWCIPAVILLILHFVLGWSLWFAVGAFALWVIGIIIWMLLIGKAVQYGNENTPNRPNKNPYSAKNSDLPHNEE